MAFGRGPGPGAIADPETPRDLALAATRERDEALGVGFEQRLGEARYALGPVEIRAGDEAAQAPVARAIPSEQHQARPALALADPAEVLLDHASMPGQASALRARPRRQALDRRAGTPSGAPLGAPPGAPPARRLEHRIAAPRGGHSTEAEGLSRGPSPPAQPAPRRHHHPARIGSGRVLQLDLDPDDRAHPHGGRRGAKRTTPYSPSWSVTARPERPSSAARSTMSSTGDAPCRNEKLVWLWSSA